MEQTLFYGIFDGGQSRDDALGLEMRMVRSEDDLDTHCGIRDLPILHRDVEVDPNQYSFTSEVNVDNR